VCRKRVASPVAWIWKISSHRAARCAGSSGTNGRGGTGRNNFADDFLPIAGAAGNSIHASPIGLFQVGPHARESIVLDALKCQPLDVNVSNRRARLQGKSFRLGQHHAVFRDKPVARINQVGARFARPGPAYKYAARHRADCCRTKSRR